MFVLILIFAGLLTFVLTPAAISLAPRMHTVDVPTDHRRMHHVAIPRNGGLGVLVPVFLCALLLGLWQDRYLALTMLGSALMMGVGLVDDMFGLGAFSKLLFQLAAALATVLGSGFGEDWGAVGLAVVWVVTLTNAHNFIDGMDGLLPGVACIEGVFLAGALYLTGGTSAAQAVLLLSVTSGVFRIYNVHPAGVFLGDCGSEPIGFFLGMLSLPLFAQPALSVSNLSPLFLFAYPLSDLVLSVLRRLTHGRSPFSADRAHLHHRIYATGIGVAQCVTMLLSVTLFFGLVGLCLHVEYLWMPAALFCLCAAALLVLCRNYLLRHTQAKLP